jgi:hypothetical protein
MKIGKFPKNFSLGGRAVGWLESEVQAWIDDLIQKRELEETNAPKLPGSAIAVNPAFHKTENSSPFSSQRVASKPIASTQKQRKTVNS